MAEERRSNLFYDSFPFPAFFAQAHLPQALELHCPSLQAAAVSPVGGVGAAAAVGPATTGESLFLPETIPNVGG